MEISKYSKIVIDEAKKMGIKSEQIGDDGLMFLLKKGKKETLIYQSLTELISNTIYLITANKYLTHLYFKKYGFPVPHAQYIKNKADAYEFLKKYKKVVVKPLAGNRGIGITVGIKSQKGLRRAIEFALEMSPKSKTKKGFKLLVEEAVPGYDNRILVIDYKHVFSIKKLPANITGDGKSSMKKLIDNKNLEVVKHKSPIIIDDYLRHILFRQGMTLRGVPAKGEKVFVRRTANLATGGESIDITDELNEDVKKMAIKAAKAFKMPVAGFDYMTRDHTGNEGYFIEVNPIPGFLIHHYPHFGKERNPTKEMLKLLIKKKLL